MKDNITFSKIWEDGDIIELKIVCSSSVATITSQIYVSDSLIAVSYTHLTLPTIA
mgnify:CR=1 FL=1